MGNRIMQQKQNGGKMSTSPCVWGDLDTCAKDVKRLDVLYEQSLVYKIVQPVYLR
jgi:hypothetical protein